MNPLILTVFILSLLLGAGHGADLLLGIDPQTGLCVAGSVWWRYLAMAVVVLAAVLAGRKVGIRLETVRSRQPLAGVLAFAAAVCFVAAGAAQFLASAGGITQLIRVVLDILCAVWFICLGRSWLCAEQWQTPTRTLIPAVFGSALFYWNVLMCFMENSSSWHRVQPTAAVWQEMAAVLFLAALIRALYLPQENTQRSLGATALAATVLCLCWQLPQTLAAFLTERMTFSLLANGLSGLGLCCVGGVAAACMAAEAKKKG